MCVCVHTVDPLVIKMESSCTHSPIISVAVCLGPALGTHRGSSNWTSTVDRKQSTSTQKSEYIAIRLTLHAQTRLTLIGRVV